MELGSSSGVYLEKLRVEDNLGYGVRVGPGSTATGNMVSGNGAFGINAGLGSEVSYNTVQHNARYGIAVGNTSTINRNTVEFNGESGIIVANKAYTPENLTLTGNEVNSNGSGIQVECPATISYNDVWGNGKDPSKGDGDPIQKYGSGCFSIGNVEAF